jgi:hypothetical protein
MKMREVSIELLRERFVYDPSTGEIRWKNPDANPARSKGALGYLYSGYVHINIGNRILRAHRMVWAMHYGEWPDGMVDHIDRVRTNNRIDNLRIVTTLENKLNSGSYGAVAAKGVWLEQKNGRYRAAISINGRYKHLGSFDTEDEAAHAYNKMAVLHLGELAVLNPIGADKMIPAQAEQAAAVRAAALEEAAKLARRIGEKRGGEWDRGENVATEIANAIMARAKKTFRALAKEAAIQAPSQYQQSAQSDMGGDGA